MSTKRRLFLIFFLISFIPGVQAATVHGTVYAWSDFEKPLKNVIVEVNSTPAQSKVATDGTYSFELSNGNYVLRARYYQDNVLEYAAEEEILIDREGSFTIDLLLLPPTELEYEFPGDINLTADIKDESNLTGYGIIILILLISAGAISYWFWKKKTRVSETITEELQPQPEKVIEPRTKELPEDLRDMYELILKKGGRITQKELRKEVKHGEAKVSLMLDDLDDRGLIKKIKKGRANIIIVEVKK